LNRKIFICSLMIMLMLFFLTGCSMKKDGKSIDEASVSDGEYLIDVGLDGGNDSVRIKTPMNIIVSKGEMYMRIEWNDSKFTTMTVDSVKYEKVNENLGIEGNSVFIIPIDEIPHSMKVVTETFPKSIDNDYKILFNLGSFRELSDNDEKSNSKQNLESEKPSEPDNEEVAESDQHEDEATDDKAEEVPVQSAPVIVETVLPEYATGFIAEIYDDNSVVIRLTGGETYLLVDDDMEVPEEFADYTVIRNQDFICIPEKSGMDFVRKLNAGDRVLEDLEGANILGLLVVANNADEENSLIARMEWIKYYGLLLGKYDEAKRFYDEEMQSLTKLSTKLPEKSRSVRFYGYSDEFVAEGLVEMSGGQYIFDYESEDADICIYADADDYKETKANKKKTAFYIDENTLNNPTELGSIVSDLIKMLNDPKVNSEELVFFERIDNSKKNNAELSDNSKKN